MTTEMGAGWTRPRFVRELARKFGNGVKATKSWALEDAIFDTLKRSNLLIVDEFHKALTTTGERNSASVLEFIRDIRDKTHCGLVLCATKVGMERFELPKGRRIDLMTTSGDFNYASHVCENCDAYAGRKS